MIQRLIFIGVGILCLMGVNRSSAQGIPVFPNTYFDQDVIGINYDGWEGYVILDESYHADTYDSAYYAGYWWRIIRAGNYSDTLGYYRIDGEKVYYKNIGMLPEIIDTTPFIIYDFGLTVGDTAYVIQDEGLTHFVVVSQIQNTTIFGSPVLELKMNSDLGFGDRWVYGMGSEYGFFYRWMNHFETVYSVCDFVAYNQDSVAGFANYSYTPVGYPCNLTNEEFFSSAGVQVQYFPEYLQVSLTTDEMLYIYDSSGKLIYQKGLPTGINQIVTSNLASGIYFLRVGERFSDKFSRY